MHVPPESLSEITKALKTLGLTKYEALVYVALLTVTKATATEIHELSGVPRASVYPVLDRLTQKNLVATSHTTPRRFSAIPPAEAVDSLMHGIGDKASYAKETLQDLYSKREPPEGGGQELLWTITGDTTITTRLRDLIAQAKDQILIAGSGSLIEDLGDTLAAAVKNTRVEVITELQGKHIPPTIPVTSATLPGWRTELRKDERVGVVLVDRSKVMVVMGLQEETPFALYSESEGFYRFFSRYWNMVRGYGEKPDQKL